MAKHWSETMMEGLKGHMDGEKDPKELRRMHRVMGSLLPDPYEAEMDARMPTSMGAPARMKKTRKVMGK